jgi:quinolinate synthase
MTTQTSTAPSVNDLIVAAPSESCDTELAEGPWVFDLVPGYGPGSSDGDVIPEPVTRPGQLPVEYQTMSDDELHARIRAAKATLGERLVILGHFYQRDEVVQYADFVGDSFQLANAALTKPDAETIVFCGVHFMAETADILARPEQHVILPNLAAGCSMADMATFDQVEDCWDALTDAGVADVTIPVTYMNSSAAIKGFTGRHGGTVCTSSNAKRALTWAFEQGEKVLFLPDQHLGRNTAVRELGLSLDDCVVFNPNKPSGGLTVEQLRAAKVILWRGHCSVHGRFTPECVDEVRERVPGVTVLVHPECTYDVVDKADLVGSTEYIIRTVNEAPAGAAFAIGTELNLVQRLAEHHPDKTIVFLEKTVCFCATMNRIDLPHLVWALESLVDGQVVNEIRVDDATASYARLALDRMLTLP